MTDRTRYTAKEIEQLRILFAQGNSDEQIAAIIGRSVFSIHNKRLQLGLKHPNAADIAAKKQNTGPRTKNYSSAITGDRKAIAGWPTNSA